MLAGLSLFLVVAGCVATYLKKHKIDVGIVAIAVDYFQVDVSSCHFVWSELT
jgi:hypothetical protein